MKKTKFSVIIPVYNVEKYLKECLDSIFAYDGELEVIAVDDGSTDASGKMLDEYPDERLKVFHKQNEGLFKTWQYGVKKSTGEYIIFVDSDDYIDSNLFSDMLRILSERDYDLIQFGWTYVFKNRTEKNYGFDRFRNGAMEGEALQKYLEETLYKPAAKNDFFSVGRWGKVFRAELLKALFPELMDDITMFEDESVTLPFLTTIRSLYMTDKSYYFYRIGRPGSICYDRSKTRNKWQDCKKVTNFLYSFGGGVLSGDWKTFYPERNYYGILGEAILAKDRELCEEIITDEHFKPVVDQGKGLKCFLVKHRMFRTYAFLSKVKNLFRH